MIKIQYNNDIHYIYTIFNYVLNILVCICPDGDRWLPQHGGGVKKLLPCVHCMYKCWFSKKKSIISSHRVNNIKPSLMTFQKCHKQLYFFLVFQYDYTIKI